MAENSYAQLIDDFENGINVLKGETLTEYIKRMGGVDYESKADGGAIGIEVLFTDKKAKGGRVGFQSGGWADGLEGEAKGIYDSMTAYGASDAEIQSKLQAQNLWSPDGSGGGGGGTGQVTGIINQNIGGGGGGIGELDLTYTKERMPPPIDPTGMLPQLSTQRTGLLGLKDKAVDFFSNLGTPKVQGTLGTRLANQPRLPLPGAMASWSMSPFNTESRNYNPLFEDQLNFLEMQDGMIGRDPNSGLMKYGPDSVLSGKNVISLMGSNNYQAALDKEVERLEGILEKNKNKWDATKIASWKAKFLEPAYLEQQTANQTFAEKQAEIEAAKAAEIQATQSKIDTSETDINKATEQGIAINKNEGVGSVNPNSAYGKSQGYTGGSANPHTQSGWSGSSKKKAQGGLISYNRGGLASMFTRRR
jgi:hypothetical protein